MTEKKPPVAIVIANYNTSNFILDAIKSALIQTYDTCGIFVTDDCSVDNSVQIIKEFCGSGNVLGEDDRFVLSVYTNHRFPIYLFELKKNVGRGGVRNFSIDFALRNNYYLIQILDSDDILKPEKVEKLANVIISDPERIGIAYSDYIILSENGNTTYESKPAFDLIRLSNGNNMIHSGAMINSLALKKVGLYRWDLEVAEDLNLWLRICNHFLAYGVAEPLCVVRSHQKDSTNSVPKEIWQRDFQKAMNYR